MVEGKNKQSLSQKNCKTNQSVAKRHFHKHFSLSMSSNFRYHSFVALSEILGWKVPVVDDILSSHGQQIYPTTSLDENCIEFEFPMDRNYYVDLRQTYLAVKLKFLKGRGYEAYNSTEVKKEHKDEAKVDEDTLPADERAGSSSSDCYSCKQHFAFIFFPMLKYTSTISKFTIQMDCMRTNPTISTTSKEPVLKIRGFCTAKV